MTAIEDEPGDIWSDWLLKRRHALDPDFEAAVKARVDRYVNRLLDGVALVPGMRLADIGCGEGAVAWRALERVGPELKVVLTDVSEVMLRHAQEQAGLRGVLRQCRFVVCGAERLTPLADQSLDVVALRSTLAYVKDKPAALAEFHRVLVPGGTLTLAEPVFRDEALAAMALRAQVAAQPDDRFLPLLHRWKAAQFPDTPQGIAGHPLTDHSERDLVRMCQLAGFQHVQMDLHIEVQPPKAMPWHVLLDVSPHPWAPTLRQVLAEQFSPDERALFEQVVRPGVETQPQPSIDRMVYLVARKAAQPA